MKIRSKVATLIATLFAALGVAAIFVASYVLMPSFAALEHTEADVALRRIQFALDRPFAHPQLSAGSWGDGADAWRLAQDDSQPFITAQLTVPGLNQPN